MFNLARKFAAALKGRFARNRSVPHAAVQGSGSRLQKLVIVDLWFYDEIHPTILQSWTWQTVDEAPEFPRSREWLATMAECCTIHHWQIKQFNRPADYDPRLVHPITPVQN